jgi:hypothetical protein
MKCLDQVREDAEIGARLATPSKRRARICGAHETHDNGPFNVTPMVYQ